MHGHRREKNFDFDILLIVSFILIEIIGGLMTNSLAILADTLHDFGDNAALALTSNTDKPPHSQTDARRTFGYRRLSVLAALIAASLSFIGTGFVLIQAVFRLLDPVQVHAQAMLGLALVGVVVNTIGFLRFKSGESTNQKVMSWHLLDHVFGWLTVLIGSMMINAWNLHYLDAVMAIGICAFTLWSVGRKLKGVPGVLKI